MLLAAWSLSALRTMLPAQFADLPGIDHLGIDVRVLAAAAVVSLVTGLIFGVLPAIAASDQRLGISLNEESRGGTGSARSRRLRSGWSSPSSRSRWCCSPARRLLVVSFNNLVNVSPGFQPAQLVIARLTLPRARYGDHARAVAFFDAVSAAPGRRAGRSARRRDDVAAVRRYRLAAGAHDRAPAAESALPVRVHPRLVSTGYFQTLGIPLVRGRGFTGHDADTARPTSRSSTKRRHAATGRTRIRSASGSASAPPTIGARSSASPATRDMKGSTPTPIRPRTCRSISDSTSLGNGFERTITLVIRTTGDAASIAPLIRTAVANVDAQVPIGDGPPDGRPDRRLDRAAPSQLSCWSRRLRSSRWC